tara:strand:- start:53 stop:760 length:708 start_codon:yes stop_codon:yes gene_type:complete
MIKAIFFDVFGTLVDWRTSLIENITNNQILEERNQIIEEFVINWRLEYQPILNQVNKKNSPWMILDDLHAITLNTVLKKMKIVYLSYENKIELVNMWHRLNPWKDTQKSLKSLGKKYITSSLSNGNIELQKKLIKYANLEFNFIISAENFKKYKPALAVYLGASNSINISPEKCLMVASHKQDLKAARKVGFKTAFISRKNEYGRFSYKFPKVVFTPDITLNSLDDLEESINSII